MTNELLMVAIVPHEPLFSELRALQDEYGGYTESKKVFELPPHATLASPFQTGFTDDFLVALRAEVEKHAPVPLTLTGFAHFTHHPTLYYSIRYSEPLSILHEDIIEVVRKFRNPAFNVYAHRHAKGRAAELLKLYGSEYVKERFLPHLSLTRSDADRAKFAEVIANLPQAEQKAWDVVDVVVLRHQPEGWTEIDRIELRG